MRKRIFRFAAVLLFLTMACAPRRAQAQFTGYGSPQTVNQVLLTSAACPIGGVNAVVTNIGQSAHVVTYNLVSGTANTVQVRLQGSQDNVNFFDISDVATNATATAAFPASIVGYGYYPVVRVNAACTGSSPTITVSYSGTSVAPTLTPGVIDQTITNKNLFNNAAASSGQSTTITAPFQNTVGVIFFQYSAGIAGSSLAVSVNTLSFLSPVSTFTIANNTSVQTFAVPSIPGKSVTVTYTSGGAGGTFIADYSFFRPGALSSSLTIGTVNQGTPAAVASAWPIKLVDSGGVNVATVSAAGALSVQGPGATGSPPVGNPNLVGATDGTNLQTLRVIGSALPATVTNPLAVAQTLIDSPGGAIRTTNTLRSVSEPDPGAQFGASGLLFVTANPSAGSAVAARTCNVFKSAIATASGNTALWTPAAGKKFRLMRFRVMVPGNAAYATTAGTVVTTLQDAAVATNITTHTVQVPLAAGTVTGAQYVSPWIDLGNGFLSATANNVLNINLVLNGAGAFSGGLIVDACGTEE